VKRATYRFADRLAEGDVSIHARVKRATPSPLRYYYVWLVSIHARVKRATYQVIPTKSGGDCFNPRPREAGDANPV